jgi:Flp pilus assembly protein TadD
MGWAIILGLTAATLGGLWFFGVRDKGALQFLGAALCLALAGYALQGHPGFRGSPKAPPEHLQLPDSDFATTREAMLGRFDRAASWLTISESYARRGDTWSAAEIIRSGLRDSPNDPDLWAGLGSALVAHSNGMMNPAAEQAFRRAEQLAPGHPAPRFYYGLALAQGGQFDEAERIWRQLLAEAPPDADYRRTIEEQLEAVRQAREMQGIAEPPQPPRQPPQPQPPQTSGR